jgi:4-hydroxy-3-polyprenylbenzoate decarboxylase
MAAAGPAIRDLPGEVVSGLHLPDGFSDPRLCLPGVLAVRGPACTQRGDDAVARFCRSVREDDPINRYALIVVVDDAEFAARTLNNFLWVVFTRSNPAADMYGVGEFIEQKHWGCRGALTIDARIKPHHAPPLTVEPQTAAKVDARAARGGPLAKYL